MSKKDLLAVTYKCKAEFYLFSHFVYPVKKPALWGRKQVVSSIALEVGRRWYYPSDH